jgi:hypothetical protein
MGASIPPDRPDVTPRLARFRLIDVSNLGSHEATAIHYDPRNADRRGAPRGWVVSWGWEGLVKGSVIQWVVGIGIIVLIAGGFLLFRDRLSGSAGDLQVGDCFHVPDAEEISDIQHAPCNESHTGEVFFVGDMPDAPLAPSGTEVDEYVEANCIPAYATYTSRDYATDEAFDINSFYPTFSGWGEGDREVTCFIVRTDAGEMTQSERTQ